MYGVKIKTTSSIEKYEAWLYEHCQGKWEVKLENVIDVKSQEQVYLGLKKEIVFYFEDRDDKEKFKDFLLGEY